MNDLQRYSPPDDEDNSFEYLPKPLNTFDSMPTSYSLERMRLDGHETRNIISSTELMMSQTLELHRMTGTNFRKITAQTKRGFIFGKSCTMTIECEPVINNITVHKGWLK